MTRCELWAVERGAWARPPPGRQTDARARSLPFLPQPPADDDLLSPGRRIAVVSTAAPPWLTGTAVNPALRAAFLAAARSAPAVTLVVPWLHAADQAELFPNGTTFAAPSDQEAALRAWVESRTGTPPMFAVSFYPARYDRTLLGVFPVGDLTAAVAKLAPRSIILEEPEHLTWHHAGPRWTSLCPHVTGVVHTNYRELGDRNAGPVMGWLAGGLARWLAAAHCHVVVKLSDAIQPLPRSVTACVHGVAPAFHAVGGGARGGGDPSTPRFALGAYALGKVVFGKGWEELVALLAASAPRLDGARVTAFGAGAALATVRAAAAAAAAPLDFRPGADHLDPALRPYRAFVNASTSDVVATTSLEALAMGKWLVCAAHPCNEFAATFTNCLTYTSAAEFGDALARALATEPAPLTADEAAALTWEAATHRLAAAARLRPASGRPRAAAAAAAAEGAFARAYSAALKVEPLRVAVGAGARTKAAPADGLTYAPPPGRDSEAGGGGLGAALVALVSARPTVRVGAGGLALEWGSGATDAWDWRWRRA